VAFHVDEPHMIAGVDRNGDYAAAGDRVAFFAESKRAEGGPDDRRRLRRTWAERLWAGNFQ
jgi:hypothetical protein